ncbi:MAG: bifunctional phosphopantothenoylcysteine decarboxylase/phosphopantothenate--cysteine ligase CoaBC [Acidiferrobacterales bacterium]|nr:bifunctional phosphopantothenoylcysteine decarboxylase/phosphopantothenate--cysteine ligase CoaBC [Acidiferrobacterales bacterium]
MTLENRKILLGVTGGIAAYRAAEVVRRLRESAAEVRVVMTPNALQFITALTMQAVSGHQVRVDLFDESAEAGMSHIELARWADMILVAPATASFMARLAHGGADDLLSTLCLATQAPVAVAPAMNQLMWSNAATQDNVGILQDRGILILGPGVGDQACGEFGPGRMLMPEEIANIVESHFSDGILAGVNLVVTAGSTWEAIDPVRGITNHSSGKMGYAIARAAVQAGARVTLISGPAKQPAPTSVDRLLQVTSARQMLQAVLEHIDSAEIFISVAAVADYRPVTASPDKIKKRDSDSLHIELARNPDILAQVKKHNPGVFAVGFAAETGNLIAEGKRKLLAKGVDLIAANDVGGEQGALGSDTNTLELIDRSGVVTIGPALKTVIAAQLIEQISIRFHAQSKLQNTR